MFSHYIFIGNTFSLAKNVLIDHFSAQLIIYRNEASKREREIESKSDANVVDSSSPQKTAVCFYYTVLCQK